MKRVLCEEKEDIGSRTGVNDMMILLIKLAKI